MPLSCTVNGCPLYHTPLKTCSTLSRIKEIDTKNPILFYQIRQEFSLFFITTGCIVYDKFLLKDSLNLIGLENGG